MWTSDRSPPPAPAVFLAAMLLLPFLAGRSLLFLGCFQRAGWCYGMCHFVIDIPLLRLLRISLVKCYRHYAPERLRRFCMCVPSCSEYAIAVLRKHLLAVAVYKIVHRLTKTCDGEQKFDLLSVFCIKASRTGISRTQYRVQVGYGKNIFLCYNGHRNKKKRK